MAVSKLPNAEGTVVELRKLRGYCLSEEHPKGKHKARVFASDLGLAAEALLAAARSEEAIPTEEDEYGSGT